jgi:hypothetical protein
MKADTINMLEKRQACSIKKNYTPIADDLSLIRTNRNIDGHVVAPAEYRNTESMDLFLEIITRCPGFI